MPRNCGHLLPPAPVQCLAGAMASLPKAETRCHAPAGTCLIRQLVIDGNRQGQTSVLVHKPKAKSLEL